MSRNRNSEHYTLLFEQNLNLRERIIYLNSDVNDCSLELVVKAMDELDKNAEASIRIEISSYGGCVYSTLGIIDRIKSSPCNIITRGWGKIMSAATFILAAGDEREMGAYSWAMIHQISDSLKGNLDSIKTELSHTNQLERQMLDMYAEFSGGKTKAKTFEKLCQKNCYLSAQEFLKLGLIDRIVNSEDTDG